MQGRTHQFRPVQEHLDADILRKHIFVKVVHHLVDLREYFGRVLVTKHLYDALHSVAERDFVIDVSEDAFPFEVAVFQFSEIPQEHRHTVVALDDYAPHVLEIGHLSDSADDIAHVTDRNTASTGIGIIPFQGLRYLVEGKVVGRKLVRIDLYLVLCGQTTEIADIRNSLDLFQCRDHRPLVQVGQFPERNGIVSDKHITVNLPGRGSEGVQFRDGAIGKLYIAYAFLDPLASPIIVCPVFEYQHDQG